MLMADSISPAGRSPIVPPRDGGDLPDPKLERIPADDSLWHALRRIRSADRFAPRSAAAPAGGGPLEAAVHKVPPDLEGVKFGDHWGVIFSPYDLSCAWKSGFAGLPRLHPPDAARIGLNVVLYSLQQ